MLETSTYNILSDRIGLPLPYLMDVVLSSDVSFINLEELTPQVTRHDTRKYLLSYQADLQGSSVC